jgi:hypothetical protein
VPAPCNRRQLLLGGGAFGAALWLGGCRTGNNLTRAPASPPLVNPQPTPSAAVIAAGLSVSQSAAGRIGPAFAGLSYEKSALAVPCFVPGNTPLIGLFRRLGPSLLRIGGNTVDRTQWRAGGAGHTAGEVAPTDIDALAAFLHGCGWQVLYGVNLATSTPAAAAAEAAYAARALGESLYGLEIGNEPDLYGDNYFAPWTLADCEERWEAFRRAILARAPAVVLTGPGDSYNVGRWTIPFGTWAGGGRIALLTQHHYRGNGRSPLATAQRLVSADDGLVAQLAELRAGAARIGVPFRLAETNSFFNGGAPGVSNSYASALWVIDHLFDIARGGGAGANLHGGGYGAGYTPIADRYGVVIGARPLYYGMLLFTLAGTGTLLGAQLSAGSLDVSAYALRLADGSLSLVVVNKEAARSIALAIECPEAAGAATLMALTGPALTATAGVEIQGATVGVDGSFAPLAPYTLGSAGREVRCYVGALSAALIRVSPGSA